MFEPVNYKQRFPYMSWLYENLDLCQKQLLTFLFWLNLTAVSLTVLKTLRQYLKKKRRVVGPVLQRCGGRGLRGRGKAKTNTRPHPSC